MTSKAILLFIGGYLFGGIVGSLVILAHGVPTNIVELAGDAVALGGIVALWHREKANAGR